MSLTEFAGFSVSDGFAATLHPNCDGCAPHIQGARTHAKVTGSVGGTHGDGEHRASWSRTSANEARQLLADVVLRDELVALGPPDEAIADEQTANGDNPLWLLEWHGNQSRYVPARVARNVFPALALRSPNDLGALFAETVRRVQAAADPADDIDVSDLLTFVTAADLDMIRQAAIVLGHKAQRLYPARYATERGEVPEGQEQTR